MKVLKGTSVSMGISIGRIKKIQKPKLQIKKKKINESEVDDEILRFEESVKNVINEVDNLIENIQHSQDNKDILTTHKMILKDPEFSKNVKNLISQELMSLEFAIKTHFTDIIEIFNKMENDYYSERSSDYEDVAYRLLRQVLDHEDINLDDLEEDSILILENITPSLVTKVFSKNIRGLCTEKGSKNSHSSIIARSLNLPMIVNAPNLMNSCEEGNQIILNGNNGNIYISPEKDVLEKFHKQYEEEKKQKKALLKLKDKQNLTKDGKHIKLMSNIEIPEEVEQVKNVNSEGIGLFRTEFLFMDSDEAPSEQKQFEIYHKIALKCEPHPVIIRTIDLGGDKLSRALNIEHEINPNLGCRGIRISLKHENLFKKQIKAILRANEKGNVKIMFPMISCVAEIKKAKNIIAECKAELTKEKIAFNDKLEIGAMIEIPSAAITSDMIAKECDFLSIGTNDLVQYTLAVDRDNPSVTEYYQPSHQSVLRLIQMTIKNAHQENVKVAICGEMASEKKYIELLIGMGIDELSVSPGRLLMIKNEILQTDFLKAKKMDEKIFRSLNEVE